MQNTVLPPDRPFQNRNGGQLSLPPIPPYLTYLIT